MLVSKKFTFGNTKGGADNSLQGPRWKLLSKWRVSVGFFFFSRSLFCSLLNLQCLDYTPHSHPWQRTLSVKTWLGTFLVVQWLKIYLPTQGTRVWSLVQEDSTCHGTTQPMGHKYWTCALEPRKSQLLNPHTFYRLPSATREASTMRNPWSAN